MISYWNSIVYQKYICYFQLKIMRTGAIWLLFALAACNLSQNKTPDARAKEADTLSSPSNAAISKDSAAAPFNPYATSRITYEIIDAPENTFGYRILVDGKVIINQPHIPGMTGIKGFGTKENATRVAEMVAGKIKNNQMPPTVTVEEMKGMNAVN